MKKTPTSKCTTCDAWVLGGMCRRIRVNAEGTLYVADKENGMAEPLAERHEYLTNVNSFGCIYHGPAVGYAYPSPGGFFFGSHWNLIVDDQVKLLHVDDKHRHRLFTLCDRLNREAKTQGYRRDWEKGRSRRRQVGATWSLDAAYLGGLAYLLFSTLRLVREE